MTTRSMTTRTKHFILGIALLVAAGICLLAILAKSANAQTPPPPPQITTAMIEDGAITPAKLSSAIAAGSVKVTIVDQGADPISLLTGTTVKSATLVDLTVCNESGTADASVDNSMIYQRINSLTTLNPGLTLYDSRVVALVLSVFEDKNVYAKLFKGGSAASTVGVILTTALKLNPIATTALAVAPLIYSAILPVVHSPEDLQALASNIVQQNTGGQLAGHSCRSGLAIARTSAAVKTEVITVQ
jgi:hypothetical protein